jgi:hypothetical protein
LNPVRYPVHSSHILPYLVADGSRLSFVQEREMASESAEGKTVWVLLHEVQAWVEEKEKEELIRNNPCYGFLLRNDPLYVEKLKSKLIRVPGLPDPNGSWMCSESS